MDKQTILIFLLSVFQLINCQDMKKDKISSAYNVQISHSDNKHLVSPIEDSIITLEGTRASLPYGGSSGTWGSSGKGFTLQGGTPIGADVIYYADSENAFYHLKAHFPKDKVLDFVQRAYAIDEPHSSEVKLTNRYINRRDEPDYDKKYNDMTVAYKSFSDLIFGFAPKGYVVVWYGYGPTQIELGEFQAELVTDKAKIKEYELKYQKRYNLGPKLFDELAIEYYLPNESPEKWKQYRTRYNWSPKMVSPNKEFIAYRMDLDYYNGERESIFRPFISNVPMEARAIPKEIGFFWRTKNGQNYEGRAFFDWSKANEAFKKAGNQNVLEFRIAPDDDSFELFINNQPLKADSLRVYRSNFEFHDYK